MLCATFFLFSNSLFHIFINVKLWRQQHGTHVFIFISCSFIIIIVMVRTSYVYFEFIQLDGWVGKMLRDHKFLPKNLVIILGWAHRADTLAHTSLYGGKSLYTIIEFILSCLSVVVTFFPFFSCSTVSFNWFGWHC